MGTEIRETFLSILETERVNRGYSPEWPENLKADLRQAIDRSYGKDAVCQAVKEILREFERQHAARGMNG